MNMLISVWRHLATFQTGFSYFPLKKVGNTGQGNIWSVIPFTKEFQTLIQVCNALHTSKLCPSKGVGHRDAHFRLEFALKWNTLKSREEEWHVTGRALKCQVTVATRAKGESWQEAPQKLVRQVSPTSFMCSPSMTSTDHLFTLTARLLWYITEA